MKPKPNTPQGASLKKRLDWITTIIPFICIVILCFLFMAFPQGSTSILESVPSIWHFPDTAKSNWEAWKNPSTLPSSGAP